MLRRRSHESRASSSSASAKMLRDSPVHRSTSKGWSAILVTLGVFLMLWLLSSEHAEFNANSLKQRFSSKLQTSSKGKPLKIYIYDLPDDLDKDVREAPYDKHGSWSIEYNADLWIYQLLTASPLRTQDPEAATLFYIPIFPTRRLHAAVHSGKSWQDSIEIAVNHTATALRHIQREYPYWAHKNGKDHFTTVTGDHARCLHFTGLSKELFGDIFLLHHLGDLTLSNQSPRIPRHRAGEVDIWPCYRPDRDILLPALIEHEVTPIVNPHTPRNDSIIYRFSLESATSGHPYHGVNVRKALRSMFEADPLPYADWRLRSMADTVADMTNSTFCVSPPGVVAHTSRFFRAIFSGCIPASFFLAYDLPFQNLIDYSAATVNIRPFDVDTTHKRLSSLLSDNYELTRLRNGLSIAQRHLRWDRPDGVEASILASLRQRSLDAA